MRSTIPSSLLASTVILALPLTTLASEEEDTLDPVVVTASKQAQLVSETLASVTVIDREQIERSHAADISDLLRFHAGLDVTRLGGPGQQTSLFMRGTNSDHTLVMIDGVRINSATTGAAPWERLRPQQIERIEVVRGPRSATHGSDAIGGVINIITRKPEQRGYFEAEAGGGRYDTREASVSAGLRGDNHYLGVGLDYFETDGFPVRPDESENRGSDNTTFTLNSGGHWGGVELDAGYRLAQGNIEYSQFGGMAADQDFRNQVARVALSGSPTDHWFSKLSTAWMEDDLEQNQSDQFVRTRRTTADWQNDLVVTPGYTLTLGAYGEHEEVKSDSFDVFDESIDNWAVYGENTLDAGRHRAVFAARYYDHENFGDKTTWNIEYSYQIEPGTRFSAGAGTAFKVPTAGERFGGLGNPEVGPESSLNYELGMHHRINPRSVLTLSLFHNEIDDLIQCWPDPCDNLSEARIRGLEAGYQLQTRDWRVRAGGTLQDPENRETGEPLARRSKQSMSLSASRDIGQHWVSIDGLLRSGSEDFGGSLGGYGLLNAAAGYRLSPQWQLNTRVENLLDTDYANAHADFGVPASNPGRSLFVNLRYHTPRAND